MSIKFDFRIIHRVIVYILGLLFLAIGVAFSVNSNLGVSPVNSLPLVISSISGISMGTCVTVVFCIYVLIQALLLQKEFKLKNLLQIVFASIFGYFVNFAKCIIGDFTLPTYAGHLTMLAISIFFVSLGLTFYLGADIVPMPMEGMALAVTKKLQRFSFHNVKIVLDTTSVIFAVILSFAIDGHIEGIREGTLLAALACGKVMGILSKFITPRLERIYKSPEKSPDLTIDNSNESE